MTTTATRQGESLVSAKRMKSLPKCIRANCCTAARAQKEQSDQQWINNSEQGAAEHALNRR
jgi:hypothetical protein